MTTGALQQRLMAMANHPTAMMERDWTEVQADLRAAASLLAAAPTARDALTTRGVGVPKKETA